jgi:hypothetical protein
MTDSSVGGANCGWVALGDGSPISSPIWISSRPRSLAIWPAETATRGVAVPRSNTPIAVTLPSWPMPSGLALNRRRSRVRMVPENIRT